MVDLAPVGPLAGVTLIPPGEGPHAAALTAVTRAFNRGDFRFVRETTCELLSAADATEQERLFAAEVVRRTAIDGAACVAGACAALLLAALWLLVWVH